MPFKRSGLASKSDIKTAEWQNVFKKLEEDQEIFLSYENSFRSKEYKWPRDPLHTWSRQWEYPYIYYHLLAGIAFGGIKTIVDIGSGVTFFPFSIADIGCDVICTDIDPICGKDILRVPMCKQPTTGNVSFRLADKNTLPFSNGEVDAVYCISVLEHIDSSEDMVLEVARILKSNGLFLLTIDIDMHGDREMGIESYQRLMTALRKSFNFLYPVITVHPKDLLLSNSGKYPYHRASSLLAVEGMILIKK